MTKKHTKASKKLRQVKEMITQPVAYWITFTPKFIITDKMIAADLSKHQALYADPKTMQQNNYSTSRLKRANGNVFHFGNPPPPPQKKKQKQKQKRFRFFMGSWGIVRVS